jgi:hypothetical protein
MRKLNLKRNAKMHTWDHLFSEKHPHNLFPAFWVICNVVA